MSFQWKSPAVAGLAASFGLLLLSLPAFAQTTTIEGTVKGPDGKPMPGVIVKIERTDVKGNYPVKTDKKGHYGHYGLPVGGNFMVSVTVDGVGQDSVHDVRPTLAMPAKVDLEVKATQATAPGAAAPPAQGLSKEAKEKYDEATKAREAQIAKNKELNDSFQAGRQALEAKMYDQAIDNFLKASMVDPMQVAVWSNLADSQMVMFLLTYSFSYIYAPTLGLTRTILPPLCLPSIPLPLFFAFRFLYGRPFSLPSLLTSRSLHSAAPSIIVL